MIRVLEVFREPIANGGQESYLMNMYRNIDRTRVQMDFFTPFTVDNPGLKAEIESMGGYVYAAGHTFGDKNNADFKASLQSFLKDHWYPIVHFHSGSTYALMEGSKLAHEAGIPNILVHSHCGGFDNLKYRIIKTISVPYLMKYPTRYLACSDLAAKWKFPKKIINEHQYTVLKNAVDLDVFRFNPEWNDEIRKELNIAPETIVVGHVGRFSTQKNHAFLIDIFQALHKKHPDSILLLAGSGELQDEIRTKVHNLGLDSSVRFLGLRKDIGKLMNAMNVFVLPSFFEGLPVVGVEEQCTGLPVVTSTDVAHELPIESLSLYLPLSDSPEQWAMEALKKARRPRVDTRSQIIDAGYEVHSAAKKLEDLYVELGEEAEMKNSAESSLSEAKA